MRTPMRISVFALGVLALGLSGPLATLAGNGPAKPAASPKPDEQKKVWTNEDVARLNPRYASKAADQTAAQPAASVTTVVTPEGQRLAPVVVPAVAPSNPLEDPAWYGRQLEELQEQLTSVESQERQLQSFRNSDSTQGMPTGLILNAPCTGITTDNLIASLEAQRQAILAQIDALDDLARGYGLAPGALVAAAAQPPSQQVQRAAVEAVAQQASAQLAGVQATVASMQDQVAALNATLQPPTPGFGGNPTTDLLERLDNRAAALQGEIDNAAEAARSLGMPPGELR